MSIRSKNILISVISLVIGGFLYVVFREGTYIAIFFRKLEPVKWMCLVMQKYSNDIYRYYLPDFLWAFALSCGLIGVFEPKKKETIICALISFLCGLLWEIAQYIGMISGTGDLCDVVMYLLACAFSIIINSKESVYEKK